MFESKLLDFILHGFQCFFVDAFVGSQIEYFELHVVNVFDIIDLFWQIILEPKLEFQLDRILHAQPIFIQTRELIFRVATTWRHSTLVLLQELFPLYLAVFGLKIKLFIIREYFVNLEEEAVEFRLFFC